MKAIFVRLDGKKQGEVEEFEKSPIRIGRSSSNDLMLFGEETRSSSRHAEILFEKGAFFIQDLASTNGTFVNNQRISKLQLKSGDVIEFGMGGSKLRFESTSSEQIPIYNSQQVVEPANKEFGRETVKIMLDKAIDKSARPWKMALAIVLAALIVVTATLLLIVSYMQNRTAPSESTVTKTNLSFAEIAQQNQRAVVLIYNKFELYDKNGNFVGEQVSNGSGFIINRDGEIVTNRHVVEPWEFKQLLGSDRFGGSVTGKIKQLGVFFADDPLDQDHMYLAKDYTTSKEADIAVLRIRPPKDLQPIKSVNEDIQDIRQGDEIAVLAFPLGLDINELTQDKRAKSSLTKGIVSKLPDNRKQIQLDVAAYEGSSGGPIFNNKGEVIGLLTSGPNDTLNFATPIQYAIKLLRAKRKQ
ncbi:MAG: trypsin-like peptidase domain-containing protein [Blastocatellia bacterium]|nr:trypsin-like peptidase domain-containing protein [Blastocatellia bacterium]